MMIEDELSAKVRADEIRIRDLKQMEIDGLLNSDMKLNDIKLDDGYVSSDVSDDEDNENIEVRNVERPIIYWYQHILNDINILREKYQKICDEIQENIKINQDKNKTREERKLARYEIRKLRLIKRQEKKNLLYIEALGVESVIHLALTELDYINWEEKLPGGEEVYKQDIENSKYIKEYLERKEKELSESQENYNIWKEKTDYAQKRADKVFILLYI